MDYLADLHDRVRHLRGVLMLIEGDAATPERIREWARVALKDDALSVAPLHGDAELPLDD